MRINIPFLKVEGWDGKKHRCYLKITFEHTQMEDMLKAMEDRKRESDVIEENKEKKKIRSGLRKCRGHKFPKIPTYVDGICSICHGHIDN